MVYNNSYITPLEEKMNRQEFRNYIKEYLINNENFTYKSGLLYKEFEDFFFVINIFYSDFGSHCKIIYNYSIKELHKERTLIDFDVQIGRDLQCPENIFTEEFLNKASNEKLKLELKKTFNILEPLEKKGLKYIYKYDYQILFKESGNFLKNKLNL